MNQHTEFSDKLQLRIAELSRENERLDAQFKLAKAMSGAVEKLNREMIAAVINAVGVDDPELTCRVVNAIAATQDDFAKRYAELEAPDGE